MIGGANMAERRRLRLKSLFEHVWAVMKNEMTRVLQQLPEPQIRAPNKNCAVVTHQQS